MSGGIRQPRNHRSVKRMIHQSQVQPERHAQDCPKVSVVIPTYNRADLLPRAVNSVLAQTYQDYEIIIVDDCSPDDTQDVAAKFSDRRIRFVRHERNRGVSAARNTGIEYARGEYIAFLDDDDEWLPMKLKEQVEVIEASSEKVGLVYGWMDTIEDSSGRRLPETRNTMAGDISEDMLAMNFPATTSVLLARTSAARQVGGFDESMAIYEDPDFIFRISERYQVEVLPQGRCDASCRAWAWPPVGQYARKPFSQFRGTQGAPG